MEPTYTPQSAEANSAPQPVMAAPQAPITPPTPSSNKGGMGPMIGAVIIVVLLLAGAFYFWQTMPVDTPEAVPTGQASATDDAYAAEMQAAAASINSLDAETSADLESLNANL